MITLEEVEDANLALCELYEMMDKYEKAKANLRSVELDMAKRYDRVKFLIQKLKYQIKKEEVKNSDRIN